MTDSTPKTVSVSSCSICGEAAFSVLGERSDGIAVLRCERCGMGVVAEHPLDTTIYYSDGYYSGGEASEPGYTDYHMVAAHSLAWTVELIRLLRQDGKVLDVGCADGYLLLSLGPPYEAYGIEVNEPLFRECEAMGIRMLGRDICDLSLRRNFSGFFDIITAIATLEHVVDIRAAVERIRDLLTPDGVLIFETPLISASHDNSMWFRSSLEHIYYPTPEGLAYLFQDVFALPLIGREVVIRNYASTFVGLATRSAEKHRHLAAWFQRLLDTPVSSLDSKEERSFRLYFDLIHAAASTPDSIALLTDLSLEQVTRPLLHRLAELWKTDLGRADSLQRFLEHCGDAALAELDGRLKTMQAALEDERSRNAQLETARRWLDQQFFNWQRVAEERGGEITALRQQIASIQASTAALEVALAQERSSREDLATALEQERSIGAALEAALEEERSNEALLEAALERERSIGAALEAALEEERSLGAAREAVLEERHSQIEALETALQQRDLRLAAIEASLAEREERIEQLLASTSWKLTAPVRAVGRSIRRVRRIGSFRLGAAVWKVARFAYRLLPISGLTRFKLRRAVLAWLAVPADTPPEFAVARLRDLVQGLTWRRAASAAALLLRGKLPSFKMHMNQLVQHTANQEKKTPQAVLTEPPAKLVVRCQELWPTSRPLVSVIIPCYNYGHFVAEAVDSVLAQTFQNFEILVVDGGSSAASLAALKHLNRPKTQVYFREERHLVGDNRNFGISRARGKYVCCLDADDVLKPTYLEKALFLLETQDYDLVSTSIRCFGGKSETYQVERFPGLADMLQGNHVTTCAVFRKDLWVRAGGFQDTGIGCNYFYEDWRLWVRFAALGARIANLVDEPLFLYRVHSAQSLSSQNQAVPSVDRQREAVAKFNQDVITEEALRSSEENRRIQVRMQEGFVNLKSGWAPAVADQTTILVAMPFLLVGGAERLMSEVAAFLGTRGFRIVVVTTNLHPDYSDSTAWFERATPEIYQLPRFLEPSRWHEFIFYLFETRNVSLLWIIGSRVFYELLPKIKADYPELKVIDLLFNTFGHTASNREYAQYFDRILVENLEVSTWLLAAGEPPERVLQIPSGVDLDAYRPHPKSTCVLSGLGIAPDSFIAGYSGRLAEEKDPEAFLEIARSCRADSQLVFLMTGAGPQGEQVRQHIEEMALGESFHFLGQVDHVRDYMSTYDVLVLPSRDDGRPVAVLESLALGVPVIASRVGGLPDLIQEGVTGFLCDPGDIGAFVERIRWLVAHPEEHRRMKTAARAFAEAELDARQMFERYEEAIRSVLRRASSEKS
jgi:glycosyltransferase involved in cell wall biosynthesis/SAM-dependent methyltransferase